MRVVLYDLVTSERFCLSIITQDSQTSLCQNSHSKGVSKKLSVLPGKFFILLSSLLPATLLYVQREKNPMSIPAGKPLSLCSDLISKMDHFPFVLGFDFPSQFQQPADILDVVTDSAFVSQLRSFPQLLRYLNSPSVLNNF